MMVKSSRATLPSSLAINENIVIQDCSIEAWLENIKANLVRTPGKLEFCLKGTDRDSELTLVPYYLEYQERYGIYFRLVLAGTEEAERLAQVQKWAESKEELDFVQITNDQSELVHNLRGSTLVGSHWALISARRAAAKQMKVSSAMIWRLIPNAPITWK